MLALPQLLDSTKCSKFSFFISWSLKTVSVSKVTVSIFLVFIFQDLRRITVYTSVLNSLISTYASIYSYIVYIVSIFNFHDKNYTFMILIKTVHVPHLL